MTIGGWGTRVGECTPYDINERGHQNDIGKNGRMSDKRYFQKPKGFIC